MLDSLTIVAITCAVVAAMSLVSVFWSLRRRRIFGTLMRLVFAGLWVALALLFGAISVGIQGYHALTREEVM